MALEQLTQDDGGRLVVPETADQWDDWVSAGRTRNVCNGDPLLDWLHRHGEAAGFEQDVSDPRTDFLEFIFDRGHGFEAAVLAHIDGRIPLTRIVPAQDDASDDIRSLHYAEQTFAAMYEGLPIIAQGVLRNPNDRTYGAPDLLVRSDVLAELFPDAISPEDAAISAADLPGLFHYRVVDVKFSSLGLDAAGHLGTGKLPYMAQVFLYNRALGRLQGYESPRSYILGRGWAQTKKGQDSRSDSCMDRLAPVEQYFQASRADIYLPEVADRAVEWVRRVRREGAEWQVLPEPSLPQLRPNMKNTSDQPWHGAKRQIADATGELTRLWNVGLEKRNQALVAGPLRWDDPACCAERVGVTGKTVGPILDRILAVNRTADGPHIEPSRIAAGGEAWRSQAHAFYVDFEWVSNLNDDFSRIPQQNGNPLIFMVGCGHVEDGKWVFQEFTVDALNPAEERRILDDWFDHMTNVTQRLAPGARPLVYHWSPAEESALTTQYRAARTRHPDAAWAEPLWFDFLKEVIKAEPVVVRGAMGFGLKAVANAFHTHGLIPTVWKDGPTDALGAMVGAWTCDAEATAAGGSMRDQPLMREIAEYNHVDCRAMRDIVEYLRQNH